MMNKKSGMMKRYQTSYETKESGSSGRKGIFNFRKSGKDVEFFKPVEGKNRINIVPYTIKTKNHPLVRKGEFEIGDKDYVMDYYVHSNVGPTETSVICLKNTFGKPCPICEQQALFYKEGKEEEAKALKAKRKVIYNVEDLKEPGKVKVFETSHYLFEKELIDEARDDEGGGFIDFADPEEGKEIKFRASEATFGKNKYFEFKSFGFEDRDEPLSDELVEQVISFDEIMEVPSYEDVQKILLGGDEDGSDEDEEKTVKKHCEDDDEEIEPVKKSIKKVEIDEEQEDDEESVPKKCSKGCNDCPFGHKFGKDTDNFSDCDDCEIWDKCCKSN